MRGGIVRDTATTLLDVLAVLLLAAAAGVGLAAIELWLGLLSAGLVVLAASQASAVTGKGAKR